MAVMFYSCVMLCTALQKVPCALSAGFSLVMCAGDSPRPAAICTVVPVTFVMYPGR